MTIRSTLLGFGALLWVAAAVCWLRARGSWRRSREGWLFLGLGVPFLIAGWFFTASSYPEERPASSPTPAPAAVPAIVVATPAATPPPAITADFDHSPPTYAAAVNASQYAAVARYPELGKAGTEFNKRFLTAHRQLRASEPDFFTDPQWPLHLADEIARDLAAER